GSGVSVGTAGVVVEVTIGGHPGLPGVLEQSLAGGVLVSAGEVRVLVPGTKGTEVVFVLQSNLMEWKFKLHSLFLWSFGMRTLTDLARPDLVFLMVFPFLLQEVRCLQVDPSGMP